jgi:hypothetical protein
MEQPPTIRDLYPHFNEEQLAEAEDALDRYLEIVLRIFERLESEGNLHLIENLIKESSTPGKNQ